MRRWIYLATLLVAVALGCKRSEKVEEVAQDDINFATQATGEVVENSSSFVIDPGSPFQRRYNYSGYFVFSTRPGFGNQIDSVYENGIDLRKCITYNPADTTDPDKDGVYTNATLNFNCINRTDTLYKNTDTLLINYTLQGSLTHIDPDTNPFIFNVAWGNPFHIKIVVDGNLIKENYQNGSIKMEQVNSTTYKLIRNIKYSKEADACRYITVNETTYVFLDQAQGWHPGDTLGDRVVKTWPIGNGTLTTCSNVKVNLKFYPTDTLRIAKCQNGEVGITSGGIKVILELPTGTQEFTKTFQCQ